MVQSLKRAHPAFFIITGLYLLVSLYRLQDIPPPWYDEMVHLNTAGHLAAEGRLWCDFYTSKFNGVVFNGMPVHWILLAAFIKLFGISLAGGRFFYVLLSVLTLSGIYGLAKKLFDERTALYSLASLASCYIFFHNSRQTIAVVPAALFSTMAMLVFYAAKEKGSNPRFVLSGCLTALAYLSHPTGLGIFFIITALFFIKKIPLRCYLVYSAAAFLTCLPYLVYVAVNFQEYIRQTLFIVKGLYPQQGMLLNMLDEIPVRYFCMPPVKNLFLKIAVNNGPQNAYLYSMLWALKNLNLKILACEIASRAPLILSLVYLGFRRSRTEGQRDILFIALFYIFLMSFHPNKFGPYAYMVMPFLAICLSSSYCSLAKKGRASKKTAFRNAAAAMVFAAYLMSNLVLIYNDLCTKKIGGYGYFIKEAADCMPVGSVVAGPAYFWLGMRGNHGFISASQIVYEVDAVMRSSKGRVKFESLPDAEQEEVIKKILASHKIEYVIMTCHPWEDITEVPALAAGVTAAMRRYLFYNARKEKDLLRSNYYGGMPLPAHFEDEVYEPPAGSVGFSNVSEEYQKSLKVYRLR